MYTESDKQLILKFLEVNYPVARIKYNHKFRRAIVLESGIFLLENSSDKDLLKKINMVNTNKNKLKYELATIINKVFNCDDSISFAILDNFLNLK